MSENRWRVKQREDFTYEITCPKCGYSFRSRNIRVRRSCDQCGAVLADRDTSFRISGTGELIEEESEKKRKDHAQGKHEDITTKAHPVCFSFFRKIRKIIFTGNRKAD